MNAIVLPFATPEEEGLDAVSRPPYLVTTRSRIDDAEREASLLRQIDEAMPAEVESLLAELDAHRAEVEADERRAAEEVEAERERDCDQFTHPRDFR